MLKDINRKFMVSFDCCEEASELLNVLESRRKTTFVSKNEGKRVVMELGFQQ